MTLVKICGITNKNDALAALRAGADFIGFIFYNKSPRNITKKNAAKIIKELGKKQKKAKKVGVFVNENPKKVKEICDFCGLDFIQLSGNESPAYCETLKKLTKGKIIKVLRIKNKRDINKANKHRAEYILFDTPSKSKFGGTGMTFDWGLLGGYKKKYFLSGGLNPKNIGQAARALKPFAVDVCSGVEQRPGKKDNKKVKEFVKNAKK